SAAMIAAAANCPPRNGLAPNRAAISRCQTVAAKSRINNTGLGRAISRAASENWGDLRQKIVRGVEVLVEGYPASITVELDVARPRHDASATMVCHRHERASAFEDDCAMLSCGFLKTPDECSGRCPLAVATALTKRTGVIPVAPTLCRR